MNSLSDEYSRSGGQGRREDVLLPFREAKMSAGSLLRVETPHILPLGQTFGRTTPSDPGWFKTRLGKSDQSVFLLPDE